MFELLFDWLELEVVILDVVVVLNLDLIELTKVWGKRGEEKAEEDGIEDEVTVDEDEKVRLSVDCVEDDELFEGSGVIFEVVEAEGEGCEDGEGDGDNGVEEEDDTWLDSLKGSASASVLGSFSSWPDRLIRSERITRAVGEASMEGSS